MKARISALHPRHTLESFCDKDLYFADYTDQDKRKPTNRGSMFSSTEFPDISSVRFYNPNSTMVCFDRFPDFAFPRASGGHHYQCECSLFPDRCHNNDWILFIETKYSKKKGAAKNPSNAYLKKALVQIVRTIFIYRKNGIIPTDKMAYAIISFPMLTEQFNEMFFQKKQRWVDLIKKRHNILIRGVNSATIRSETSIRLRPVDRG